MRAKLQRLREANGYTQQTFDDYSYTSESSQISLEALDLAALLDSFIITEPRNGVTLRMRRL